MARAKNNPDQIQTESWISDRADGAVVLILASPRSSANGVGPVEGNELRVRVTSAPTEGAANEAILKTIAQAFGVPKSSVRIVSGHTSRHKRVLIQDFTAGELKDRLRI